MNILTNMFFPRSEQRDSRSDDNADGGFASGYGNRLASQKFFAPLFAPLGHARRADDEDADTLGPGACAVGGCG